MVWQATVADLKERLVSVANIPQERQRVIYKGRVLDNEQQLSSHGRRSTICKLWTSTFMCPVQP